MLTDEQKQEIHDETGAGHALICLVEAAATAPLLAQIAALTAQLAEARKETGEQARLNGMGAEREARLMAEVGGLKAARIAYASEFPPIPDGDDAGLPAVGCIHENIRRLKAENAELKAKLTKKAELLRGCYARINTLERTLTHIHGVALAEDHRDLPGIVKDAAKALEKKHEGT